jgi:myo-inositol-1(or 4)-monophosphatase
VVPSADWELAIAAAQAAAAVVRARFGTAMTRFEKSPGDFATEADLEAEQAILDMIRAARPEDAVVGEETGRTGAGRNDRVWLVDPLCGTHNYAAGIRLVSVNVALRAGGNLVAAASADPFGAEVFWTDGTGAAIRRGDTDQPLCPSAGSRLVDVDLHGASIRRVSPAIGQRFHLRAAGSSLPLAWVAAGRCAAYITAGQTRDSVHFASGIAICRAAGCVVTDLAGRPLDAGTAGLIVAADPQTHAALMALVNDHPAAP